MREFGFLSQSLVFSMPGGEEGGDHRIHQAGIQDILATAGHLGLRNRIHQPFAVFFVKLGDPPNTLRMVSGGT